MKENSSSKRKIEQQVFLFICIVLFPALSVAIISGYGLAVWISQMIFGPPTL